MKYVEQFGRSYAWAEPLQGDEFDVQITDQELQISGLWPTNKRQDRPFDLLSRYEMGRKKGTATKQQTGKGSPHIMFVNADSDEKLIAFVRTFGPVVAKSIETADYKDRPGTRITAKQDFAELKTEQSIYRSALSLVMELERASSTRVDTYDDQLAKSLIQEIAAKTRQWPHQWDRECAERENEPLWRPSAVSLSRIEQLGLSDRDILLSPVVDARIVLCELVNVFPALAFPNPLEFQASIRYGIRPLLYTILRREFLHFHATEVCANDQCRQIFEIKRGGQQFCNSGCSRQCRQREYWGKRGKNLRMVRFKKKTLERR
jgi:hypothetical protein